MYVNGQHRRGSTISSLWLARDEGATGVIAFGWPAVAGQIGERELRTARMLLPHLQRAAAINWLFDLTALQQASFVSLSVPIFLVNETMTIVHANHAVKAALADGNQLRARRGVLGAAKLAVSRALAVAVHAAADHAPMGRKGMGIPIPRNAGEVGALYVLPLRNEMLAAQTDPTPGGAVAAVFLAPNTNLPVASPDLVAALFGLTKAEARVFENIAAGATVAATADLLQVREDRQNPPHSPLQQHRVAPTGRSGSNGRGAGGTGNAHHLGAAAVKQSRRDSSERIYAFGWPD